MSRPNAVQTQSFPPQAGDWLWVPLRSEWRDVRGRPEEVVRQDHIRHLVQTLGYSLDQMDREGRVMHGVRNPRADIVVGESAAAMAANRTPALVIECKAESVDIIRAIITRAKAIPARRGRRSSSRTIAVSPRYSARSPARRANSSRSTKSPPTPTGAMRSG